MGEPKCIYIAAEMLGVDVHRFSHILPALNDELLRVDRLVLAGSLNVDDGLKNREVIASIIARCD